MQSGFALLAKSKQAANRYLRVFFTLLYCTLLYWLLPLNHKALKCTVTRRSAMSRVKILDARQYRIFLSPIRKTNNAGEWSMLPAMRILWQADCNSAMQQIFQKE